MKRNETSSRRGRTHGGVTDDPDAIPHAAVPVASVLVVDDTVMNLHLLSDLLGKHGYEVRAVTSGRQALKAVEHDPPDLILLDIAMPGMDGYEVCRQLRAMERSKEVPVIFLTALTDTADKIRAFDAGGVDYVTKPFQFEEVLARVRTHVALKRAQSALTASYERLRAVEQLRDDLVHMVVHDMRSPLTVLHTSLDLLKRAAVAPSEDSRQDLQAASDAAHVLTRMANDLLDVSRLEEGRMPIERAECDLTPIAHEVRSALRTLDLERPIDIESAGAVWVTCDAALVRRVIENLVSNGIRHTPAGSRLCIAIARGDRRVRVAVHDEGYGVPPDARRKIFEKFGTVETRQDQTYHSSGLGLAFCKLAIEAHGGTIGVDPRVPAGSTFWFELPA
jgi:two-component system, sensor histidine kinase and response regulator